MGERITTRYTENAFLFCDELEILFSWSFLEHAIKCCSLGRWGGRVEFDEVRIIRPMNSWIWAVFVSCIFVLWCFVSFLLSRLVKSGGIHRKNCTFDSSIRFLDMLQSYRMLKLSIISFNQACCTFDSSIHNTNSMRTLESNVQLGWFKHIILNLSIGNVIITCLLYTSPSPRD